MYLIQVRLWAKSCSPDSLAENESWNIYTEDIKLRHQQLEWKINVVRDVTPCTVVENYTSEEPAASSISTHHLMCHGDLYSAITVKLCQTTRRQVSEDSNLHGHHVETWNLTYWYFVKKDGK